MVQRTAPPQDLDAPDLPGHVDYVDAFAARVPEPHAHTARAWLEGVLADAPPALIPVVRAAQSAMGLRLDPPDPPHLALGWQVLHERPDQVVIGVEGAFFTPRVVLTVRDQALLITTMLRFHGRTGRLIWRIGSPLHRTAARLLAATAERRAGATGPTDPGVLTMVRPRRRARRA